LSIAESLTNSASLFRRGLIRREHY
jgi:hypothetical protein